MSRLVIIAVVLLLTVGTSVDGSTTTKNKNIEKRATTCILPPYPNHGSYSVGGEPNAVPGDSLDNAFLNVTCEQGYSIFGKNTIFCVNGQWSSEMPTCDRSCKLLKHSSVEYRCSVGGPGQAAMRECQDFEPQGIQVMAQCKPGYRKPGLTPPMRCIDGSWNNVVICSPDCGKARKPAESLVGTVDIRNPFPWYALIYKNMVEGHRQICAGSIISPTVVITAAHCLRSDLEVQEPLSAFSLAVGKFNKKWDSMEQGEQKVDIKDIKVPDHFRGATTNYQDDIALIILSSPLQYSEYVRPVCLDFDYQFDSRQLRDGNIGEIPTWMTRNENESSPSVRSMRYIPISQCFSESPANFREYITSDKFCAVVNNGTFGVGNSGSGLVFPETDLGVTRYYLRGITSTSPSTDMTGSQFVTFTHIAKHEHFIKANIGTV